MVIKTGPARLSEQLIELCHCGSSTEKQIILETKATNQTLKLPLHK
jgi:hypothetical protein